MSHYVPSSPPPWLLLIKEVGYEAIPRNARKNFEIGITLRTVRLGESKFAGEGKERGNRRLRQLATVLRLLEPYKQSTRSLELQRDVSNLLESI